MRLISISTILDLGYKTRQMNFHRSCSGRNFPLMFHWSFFYCFKLFFTVDMMSLATVHPSTAQYLLPTLPHILRQWPNESRIVRTTSKSPIFISAVKIGLATRPPRCPVWLAGRWCGSQCPRPRDQPGAGTCSCIAVLLTHCTLTVLHGAVL